MIYTVGNYESYEKYFDTDGNPKKAIGGSVWNTKEEAEKHANKEFSVYGIDATWRVDTTLDENGLGWDRLLVDAPLVKV